jgi:hypothetical protein
VPGELALGPRNLRRQIGHLHAVQLQIDASARILDRILVGVLRHEIKLRRAVRNHLGAGRQHAADARHLLGSTLPLVTSSWPGRPLIEMPLSVTSN